MPRITARIYDCRKLFEVRRLTAEANRLGSTLWTPEQFAAHVEAEQQAQVDRFFLDPTQQ